MTEVAQPGLYAENPFRILGLRVFASPGEIARRSEELSAIGVPRAWAFAPAGSVVPARMHEAAQTLKGGLGRLFAEFFWFWPENYPEEKSDPAIEALARGDMEAACDYWEAALGSRRSVAAHNLAVLFHLVALDREAVGAPLDAEIAGWWSVAGENWALALGDDELWARLESRLKRFDDPRVPADFARRVRDSLPQALQRIQVAAAVARAAKGQWHEAATLVELLRKHGPSSTSLREALETGLGPLLGGAKAAVDEAARRIYQDSRPCLPDVEEMLRRTTGARRVAQVLAELGSETGRLLANRVVETAVTGVTEHRRRTRAHSAVLPWLVHLSTLPAEPAVASRVAEARNATLADVLTTRVSTTQETDPVERMETGLRVISEVLVPAAERVDWWDATTRAAYRAQVGVLLRELAHDAFEMLDDFDLPSRAFALAAEVSGPQLRADIMQERRKLWRQFIGRHKDGMRLEHNGNALEIDARRLVFNGSEILNDTVTRVWFGSDPAGPGSGFRVGWCGAKEGVELDSLNLLEPDEDTTEIFQLIVDTLEVYVLPGLAERIVQKVRGGESVVLGPAALRPEGFVFRRRASREGGAAVAVPYAQLTCKIDGSDVVIGRSDDPSMALHFASGEVWNAVVMPQVLSRLAGRA